MLKIFKFYILFFLIISSFSFAKPQLPDGFCEDIETLIESNIDMYMWADENMINLENSESESENINELYNLTFDNIFKASTIYKNLCSM
tara:strand:+ start:144 stop:410 length:267 start_codon:yes stop_codon:yes gene_type:complete